MFGYFAVINAASLVGVAKGSLGQVSGVWSSPRALAHETARSPRALLPIGVSFLVLALALPLGAMVFTALGSHDVRLVVFWGSAGLLSYVYLGYPIVLAALRAIARRPVTKNDMEPTVCLFIAAHNEEGVIDAKLRNALALDYPADRLDIVVASDGSRDGTNGIVRRFAPRVRLLEFRPRRGKAAAINEGLLSVRSEIVVLSDANTFLERTAVREIVRNFADPEVGAASGEVALVGDRAALGRSEDIYYLYEHWIQQAESDIGSMIGADGALYAVRRALFTPPPSDTILDDMAIPMAIARTGHRVVFEPAARAYEQGSETAREEFSRKARVVAGALQFMARRDSAMSLSTPQLIFSFISHKALRWLSPAFAACAFLASVMLASTSAVYAVAAAAQAVIFAGGVAGCVPVLRRSSLIAIAHYYCLVQVAAVVGFLRGLTGRQSVLWDRSARVQREAPYHAPGGGH
jgi:cellulose synthase/poly-beta-1,6-N-acetylglucosamine synthase-like glycosyltransferase